MDYTTDAFLNRLYEETAKQRGRTEADGKHTEAYRQKLKLKVRQALGAFPETETPLRPLLLETKNYDDFRLERVTYSTMASVNVPVMVLIPKQGSGPWPAVLACHGHGNGQRDAAGLDPEGVPLNDPGNHNRFAVELVRRGMVVVIPEIMGFGVRRMAEELQANPNYSSCGTLSSQLLVYGKTLAGMRVYEAIRAIDYVQSRQDVIGDRVGIFGFSGGGLIAAFTSVLDERVRATVLTGWTNTFRGSILAMHHCIDNYLPNILLEAEQPEIVGLIAPRALFVESSDKDRIFPASHVQAAICELKAIYAGMEAEGCFDSDQFPGGHQISGRKSFDWLANRLRK